MVHLKGRQNVQKSDLEQRASIIKKKIIVFIKFFFDILNFCLKLYINVHVCFYTLFCARNRHIAIKTFSVKILFFL